MTSHRLTTTILHSLLFDNSSTVAVIALAVLTKLLPIFAVKATEQLKRYVPLLVLVLARVVCWRERPAPKPTKTPDDSASEFGRASDEDEGLPEEVYMPPIHEDITWERLEQTFLGGASSAPSPHRYFTMLYYLFPCNTIRFLRYPLRYVTQIQCDNPYAVGWDVVLDEPQIKSRSEVRGMPYTLPLRTQPPSLAIDAWTCPASTPHMARASRRALTARFLGRL